MSEPVALWHAEHVNFLRLLDVLARQMSVFQEGERPNYELMRNAVQYLRHFPGRYHHPREDIAFACLLKKNPALQGQISFLLQEHRVIAASGEELLARLEDAASDVMISRETLEAAAATHLLYYRHHIYNEERDILPLAAQHLTGADWKAVAAAVPPAHDPLFGDDADAQYRDLRHQIALDSQA